MRGSSAWSCSSCVVLLFSAFWGQDVAVSASHAGRQHQVNRDVIHWVSKAQVTAMAVLKRQEGEGGGVCATDHSLCPQSLSGGCCPNRYSCAVDSCVATTAGPASGCGKVGFYRCADGGCCRVGYICGKNQECFPPASVTLKATSCPNNYSLCPSSLSFGCCKSGMGCAVNGCYSTNPVTSTVTRTELFTSGTRVLTTTTTATFVATPTPPTGVPTAGGPDGEAKFIPTSVPKVPVQNSGSGSSLSGGAIGGIVAGVVIILIVVVVAAFLIIRKLNKVVEVTDSKKSASDKHTATKISASQTQQMEVYSRDLHSPAPYADDFGNDPLYIANNSTPQPDGAAADSNRKRSDSNPGGFTPSPNMFHDSRSRHASPDSNVGYFDHPGSALMNQNNMNQAPMQPARIRSSTDSNNRERGYQYTHWRQQSNASELSADGSDHGHHSGVNSPLVIPELEASGGFAELPGQGQGHEGTRSRSGSASSRPQNRQRSDTQQSRSELGLSPLDEEVEIHGYYGRRDQQAGQTAAGLEELDWDVSSPVIPGYIPPLSPPQPQEPQHGYYSPHTPQPPPK